MKVAHAARLALWDCIIDPDDNLVAIRGPQHIIDAQHGSTMPRAR